MNSTSDILIIGGGLYGLGLAYEAGRRGYQVQILDRVSSGVAHQAAAGMLAPISEAEPVLAPLTRFGLDSLSRYSRFIKELEADSGLNSDFQQEGAVHVAVSHDQLSLLSHIYTVQQEMGLKVQQLDVEALRELEPKLSPRIQGGLLLEEEGHLDPQALVVSLKAAVQTLGVKVATFDRLDGWVKHNGAVAGAIVHCGSQTLRYESAVVVAAAGARTHQLPDLDWLPLRPVKGQVVRLQGEVLLGRAIRTPDVYLVPRSSGCLWVGASVEEVGYDAYPRAGEVMELLWEARRVLPGVAELHFEQAISGFRPALRDHLPAIGPSHQKGLWVCCGHYRNGVLLLPATLQYLLDSIDRGQIVSELIPFSPLRFSEEALDRKYEDRT